MYAPRGWSSAWVHLCLRVPIVTLVVVGLCFALPSMVRTPEVCEPFSMVSITFDDGYKSVVERAFPILEKYGFKATAYIITDAIGCPGFMNWDDLRFLQDNGWEIGSHTVTHPHLPELTEAQICQELFDSRCLLEEQGLVIRSFASPYGEYNKIVLDVAAEFYDSHRTAWPAGLNNMPLLNPDDGYLLRAVSADEIAPQEVKSWIIQAKEENKWLILVFHYIDEGGDYSYSSEEFEDIIQFLAGNGFRQFPPQFVLDQDFSCKEVLSPIWPDLQVFVSVNRRPESNQTSLLFALDWQGKEEICFKGFEVVIRDDTGREVAHSRVRADVSLEPGQTCFEILVRSLPDGYYNLELFLKDCQGETWVAPFSFWLGPCPTDP